MFADSLRGRGVHHLSEQSGHGRRALAATLMDIFVFGGDINDNCDCSGAKRTANHFISNADSIAMMLMMLMSKMMIKLMTMMMLMLAFARFFVSPWLC